VFIKRYKRGYRAIILINRYHYDPSKQANYSSLLANINDYSFQALEDLQKYNELILGYHRLVL
jgi:hypothetical protein